ncbi:MAG: ATP--guanido phosphotransferase [Elusimicrobia bacterium]|nr:ATP--guanido phosphotransferase [Elusimicrobiota bacterium]
MLKIPVGWARADGPRHDVVLSSRIRLARNLADAPFPARSSAPALKRSLEAFFGAARRVPELSGAAFVRMDDLDATDRLFLVERHLVSPHLAENPSGRGAIVADGECLSLMINEEDHLRLAALRPGLSLPEAHSKARAVERSLASALPFAFRRDWGYLTSCPTNLGTAMRVSALVHLPGLALAGLIERLFENLTRLGLIVRGLYGEGTKVLGDFYQISNAAALGRTEAEIIAAVGKAVGQVADREAESRAKLCAGSGRNRIEDLVHRSAGVLQNARLLSFEEAGQHLSYLRMGLGLGWSLPGSPALANELAIVTQPAHMQMRAQRELSPPERDAARAAFVRARLAAATSFGRC